MMLDLGHSKVILSEGLDIHGQRYSGDLCGTICDCTIAHRWKFMDLKCTFEVCGSKWHKLQVHGPKNAPAEFMDLCFQSLWT